MGARRPAAHTPRGPPAGGAERRSTPRRRFPPVLGWASEPISTTGDPAGSASTPPPAGAELPSMAQRTRAAVPALNNPPPARPAELPERSQAVRAREPVLKTPPPSAAAALPSSEE